MKRVHIRELSSISGLPSERTERERIFRQPSSPRKKGDEPYYPVNDEKNQALYEQYKTLSEKEEKLLFGGRLGEYKYYDMDAVIAAALEFSEKILG